MLAIRDTKGAFHAKMGSIMDRNGMDLTEAEDIKKWQEYTEDLYKKGLNDPDNYDGMISYLEPDILECKVKWALGKAHSVSLKIHLCTEYLGMSETSGLAQQV